MFKVEQNFYYGWDDAGWTENDKPLRFPTMAAGEKAIDDLISDVAAAVKAGHMEENYKREDYRVVPITDSE